MKEERQYWKTFSEMEECRSKVPKLSWFVEPLAPLSQKKNSPTISFFKLKQISKCLCPNPICKKVLTNWKKNTYITVLTIIIYKQHLSPYWTLDDFSNIGIRFDTATLFPVHIYFYAAHFITVMVWIQLCKDMMSSDGTYCNLMLNVNSLSLFKV